MVGSKTQPTKVATNPNPNPPRSSGIVPTYPTPLFSPSSFLPLPAKGAKKKHPRRWVGAIYNCFEIFSRNICLDSPCRGISKNARKKYEKYDMGFFSVL
jgi:hypothetical protein